MSTKVYLNEGKEMYLISCSGTQYLLSTLLSKDEVMSLGIRMAKEDSLIRTPDASKDDPENDDGWTLIVEVKDH